ncbi:MAG TPA: hypothetical protein P5072_09735, partial [Parvularculaceae bacterium]|nr:hypothetical protein [Parvularculaceae bacterium]
MKLRLDLALLAATAAFAGSGTVGRALAAEAKAAEGSLYPQSAAQRDNSPLAKALGSARYVLDDIGQ